jgi:hypothetical protein
LAALRAGHACEAPVYDFKTSSRTGYRCVPVPTSRVVLVEGTYALSDALRPLLDLRVAVTGGVHRDLIKRVLRDVTRSGQAPEEIISQISETVYPMYKAFIEPDLQTAHLKIQNNYNPFSGFANPTYVLKADATGLDAATAAAALGSGCAIASESGTVDIYLLPPHEEPSSCATWLRMRSRDGRYLLVFEEFVTDGGFIISPNVRYEVNVRILGGLMALGYTVGAILKRSSVVLNDEQGLVTIKIDSIEGFATPFVQVQGRLRAAVEEVARRLGLEEAACIPLSYIQQVQNMRKDAAAASAAAAQQYTHGLPASAADALSLFGVGAYGSGGRGSPGAEEEEQRCGSAAPLAPHTSFGVELPPPPMAHAHAAPATPAAGGSGHSGGGGSGARIAALCARVDALHDAVSQLQHAHAAAAAHAHALGAWSAVPLPPHDWPPFAPHAPPSLPPSPGVSADIAAVAAGQRALAAHVESIRTALAAPLPHAAQLQPQQQLGWERLALAAAAGAVACALALRVLR